MDVNAGAILDRVAMSCHPYRIAYRIWDASTDNVLEAEGASKSAALDLEGRLHPRSQDKRCGMQVLLCYLIGIVRR